MSTTFRNSAAFGKRMEFYVVGLMLKEGLDVYLPLVDDDAIDAVVKKPDGSYVEIQIKARSNDVKFGSAGLFAGLKHEERANYWFVFYSQRMDTIWIMSSNEFIKEARQNKSGVNKGKRTIKFNGRNSKLQLEHILPQYQKYAATDFSRIQLENSGE
ncbi:hypothetical protein NQT66_13185 [Cellulophaga baltica]|uniref:hypothetical protein n=1 Tax=Cellulophaga baltica TaxID=76594 RepID=UPI0021481C00|nr:hypothetical protein [Cellulophaga baltica]MCR1025770.1 hypothetical protein [Cellulophaga baltica]